MKAAQSLKEGKNLSLGEQGGGYKHAAVYCSICKHYFDKDVEPCVDDTIKDHMCDDCNQVISSCVDEKVNETGAAGQDHKCDICGEDMNHDRDGGVEPEDPIESNRPRHIYYCSCGFWHELEGCNQDGYSPMEPDGEGYKHTRECTICGHDWAVGEHTDSSTFEESDIELCADSPTDNDNNCDKCGQPLGTVSDGNTDPAGPGESIPSHECSDSHDMDEHLCDDPDCDLTVPDSCWDVYYDWDHECEECGEVLGGHEDNDNDHGCDGCLLTLTSCEDSRTDDDHNCDICGEYMPGEDCWDNGENYWDIDGHTCDAIGCGRKIDPYNKSFCIDKDDDGACDECGYVLGTPVVKPDPLPAVRPIYKVTVEGKDGKIERINETSIVYEDMWMRVSLGFEVDGQSYAVIAMVKVEWAEGQVGVLGYFDVPNVQGSGARTGASYLVMIDENADEITISGAVKDSFGMLIQ